MFCINLGVSNSTRKKAWRRFRCTCVIVVLHAVNGSLWCGASQTQLVKHRLLPTCDEHRVFLYMLTCRGLKFYTESAEKIWVYLCHNIIVLHAVNGSPLVWCKSNTIGTKSNVGHWVGSVRSREWELFVLIVLAEPTLLSRLQST